MAGGAAAAQGARRGASPARSQEHLPGCADALQCTFRSAHAGSRPPSGQLLDLYKRHDAYQQKLAEQEAAKRAAEEELTKLPPWRLEIMRRRAGEINQARGRSEVRNRPCQKAAGVVCAVNTQALG